VPEHTSGADIKTYASRSPHAGWCLGSAQLYWMWTCVTRLSWLIAHRYLNDTASWSNAQFLARLGDRNYRAVVAGWADQAAYVDHALDALGDSPEVRASRRPPPLSWCLLSQFRHDIVLWRPGAGAPCAAHRVGCAPAQPAMHITFSRGGV